ncbi:hypothetical protein V495_02781 [Pseudogymnoascus sp. VKM F-4514 (FW-929)]|nr:hypothetical protein V495_02781 [Pseudogymnoascus sp. VKM F-4514 (FW-929)]KFY56880.1 hypothetical protein V497_05908 [Pseudogymnoascus sp. VKM F-4516 (FW-969)]
MADPNSLPLSRSSVLAAHTLITPYIHRTPVLTSTYLDQLASTPRTAAELADTPWAGKAPANPKIRLWFKCENFQKVGAFKARGAFHSLLRLVESEGWEEGGGRERGVVTHSSGNHAQAVSLASATLKIPAHIVMPRISTPAKIAATQAYGARVLFSGSTAPEREAVVAEVIKETGSTLIPPYDHPHVMIGQGTAGLELQEQVVEAQKEGKKGKGGLNAIITPCGGGGLLSGTALSAEGTGILVFGAEPEFEGADDCKRGLAAGKRIEVVKSLTIGDGLRTPVGAWPWKVISNEKLVRGVYSVTEEQIKATLRLVLERMKVVVEPSAVVGLAVALWNEDFRKVVEKEGAGEEFDLGVVFTGGNVNLEGLGKLFESK